MTRIMRNSDDKAPPKSWLPFLGVTAGIYACLMLAAGVASILLHNTLWRWSLSSAAPGIVLYLMTRRFE